MNKEDKILWLIASDLAYVIEDANRLNDFSYGYTVLSGEGWKPYNQLSDTAIDKLFNELSESYNIDFSAHAYPERSLEIYKYLKGI